MLRVVCLKRTLPRGTPASLLGILLGPSGGEVGQSCSAGGSPVRGPAVSRPQGAWHDMRSGLWCQHPPLQCDSEGASGHVQCGRVEHLRVCVSVRTGEGVCGHLGHSWGRSLFSSPCLLCSRGRCRPLVSTCILTTFPRNLLALPPTRHRARTSGGAENQAAANRVARGLLCHVPVLASGPVGQSGVALHPGTPTEGTAKQSSPDEQFPVWRSPLPGAFLWMGLVLGLQSRTRGAGGLAWPGRGRCPFISMHILCRPQVCALCPSEDVHGRALRERVGTHSCVGLTAG